MLRQTVAETAPVLNRFSGVLVWLFSVFSVCSLCFCSVYCILLPHCFRILFQLPSLSCETLFSPLYEGSEVCCCLATYLLRPEVLYILPPRMSSVQWRVKEGEWAYSLPLFVSAMTYLICPYVMFWGNSRLIGYNFACSRFFGSCNEMVSCVFSSTKSLISRSP